MQALFWACHLPKKEVIKKKMEKYERNFFALAIAKFPDLLYS